MGCSTALPGKGAVCTIVPPGGVGLYHNAPGGAGYLPPPNRPNTAPSPTAFNQLRDTRTRPSQRPPLSPQDPPQSLPGSPALCVCSGGAGALRSCTSLLSIIHLEEPEPPVSMRNCSCPGPSCPCEAAGASVSTAQDLKPPVLALWVHVEGLELPTVLQVHSGEPTGSSSGPLCPCGESRPPRTSLCPYGSLFRPFVSTAKDP